MSRLIALLPVCALAAATTLALSSCGGGEEPNLLSGRTASQINENLDQVQQRVAAGDCIGAENSVAEVRIQIEDLEGVDHRLKAALSEGAAKLEEAVTECDEVEAEEVESTVEPTVEAEEPKKPKKPEKPEKNKPEKEPKEVEEPVEEEAGGHEGPTLPPQSEGKGEENGQGGPSVEPEAEGGTPSGGVGPSTGVGD